MEKIEINEENYELYQKLMEIKENQISAKYKSLPLIIEIGSILGMVLVGCLGMIPATHLALTLGEKLRPVLGSIIETDMIESAIIGCYGVTFVVALLNLPKIVRFVRTRIFHKKHPDLYISKETEELEKELEKYEQLSKLPNDIEKQKEEHLEVPNASYRQMSAEERVELLEKEKAFWEQVAIQEKYQETGEDIIGQIGIEQKQSSAEKVYHI